MKQRLSRYVMRCPVKIVLLLLLPVIHDVSCDPSRPLQHAPSEQSAARLKQRTAAQSPKCGAGSFFDIQRNLCQPCPHGKFRTSQMAEDGMHRYCMTCHEADENIHEVVVVPCSKTSDTVILCAENYYRKNMSSSSNSMTTNLKYQCTQCGICGVGHNRHLNYTIAHCHGYEDTVCCQNASMIVENGKCLSPATLQPGDTGTTHKPTTRSARSTRRAPESTVRTTEHAKTGRGSCGNVVFANSRLVLWTFLMCLFVHFFLLQHA